LRILYDLVSLIAQRQLEGKAEIRLFRRLLKQATAEG
jgi:hypothetical protein